MLTWGMNLELMQEVKRRVLAEPEMVNMCKWQVAANRTEKRFLFFSRTERCGTIGCIAGHAIAARGGDVTNLPLESNGDNKEIR